MSERDNLIIACGERIDGNSDYIANFIKNNTNSDIVFLRELNFLKCDHCYACEKTNKCKTSDDATLLFNKMFLYKNVVFVSPVIFFNFPSHAKTFIDRAQFNWSNKAKKRTLTYF